MRISLLLMVPRVAASGRCPGRQVSPLAAALLAAHPVGGVSGVVAVVCAVGNSTWKNGYRAKGVLNSDLCGGCGGW
jgi:hypothetical protein